MKKFSRSFILKTIAFILAIACIGAAGYFVCETLLNSKTYNFEESADFVLEREFRTVRFIIENALSIEKVITAENGTRTLAPEAATETVNEAITLAPREAIAARAEETLSRLSYIQSRLDGGHIDYYITLDGTNISNVDRFDREYYVSSPIWYIFDANGESYNMKDYSRPDVGQYAERYDECVVMAAVNPEYAKAITAMWNIEKQRVESRLFLIGISLIAGAIICLIYLFWVCGRNGVDDDIHLLLIDRMYVEITLSVIIAASIGYAASMFVFISDVLMPSENVSAYVLYALAVYTSLTAALDIALIESLIRNLKNGSFIKRSLIAVILRLCFRLLKWAVLWAKRIILATLRIIIAVFLKTRKILSGARNKMARVIIRGLGMKIGLTAAAALFVYTVFILFCAYMSVDNEWLFLFILGGFVFAVYTILKNISDFDKIKDGVFEIRKGNVGFKIEGASGAVMGDIAEAVNSIGDGLLASVEKEVRAERMKSELITNVSHDLKTPLTSIINYIDILSKEKLTPDEANDYVKIIQGKALKLKDMTAALFDLSKVQSGNDKVEMERLDISLLINQALAEQEEAIKNSGLDFRTSLAEDLYVMGDGKKMSAVFENLIINAVKYSMKNTRIYINAQREGEAGVIEIKNIASYQMNFSGEEIVERFVRGDISRGGEGNGLGLAIAKSYTEVCGGKFKVIVDGDLFKARIELAFAN